MLYRTLHTYILRELLRIFLLTASALTTLLAFGGIFRPFTKQGVDISQLLVIMMNLMPAMLAYAIPIAALFAAVLVYWRMSTDNELTACRAGGISFISIVMPAFMLGLVVASIDLVFVNYVVPRFLQSTERAVMRDVGSLVVGLINRQEKFQYDKLLVYADSAELDKSDNENVSKVRLHGMAASQLEQGKPNLIVIAREATLTITNLPGQDAVEIDIALIDASGFNPAKSFQKISGQLPNLFTADGRPFILPSQLKSKPKFLNWRELFKLNQNPSLFPPVADAIAKIEDATNYQEVSRNLFDEWTRKSDGGKVPIILTQAAVGTNDVFEVRIFAPDAKLNLKAPPTDELSFLARDGVPVRVEHWSGKTLQTSYTCDTVDIQLTIDQFSGTGTGASRIGTSLYLHDNLKRRIHTQNIGPFTIAATTLSGIILPPDIKAVPDRAPLELLDLAHLSKTPAIRKLDNDARDLITDLFQRITSEFHSRGSFSLSCLTLVLFGAALGILLKGKNPLAVFVVGFVPAMVLVMLITAGRQLAEGSPKGVTAGIALIWGGNIVLLVLIAGVYAKLLRH